MTDKTEAMDNLIAQDADLIEICSSDLVQQLFAEADNFKVDREVGVRGMLYCAADLIESQAAEIEQWRECALYDATMEGPVFKGWDRSALERCRRAALEQSK